MNSLGPEPQLGTAVPGASAKRVKSLSDLGGERAYYSYDANGNQTSGRPRPG
jgi:hypothetical protein